MSIAPTCVTMASSLWDPPDGRQIVGTVAAMAAAQVNGGWRRRKREDEGQSGAGGGAVTAMATEAAAHRIEAAVGTAAVAVVPLVV